MQRNTCRASHWILLWQVGYLVESYPSLSREDISAAVAYAAELARERIIELRAVGE